MNDLEDFLENHNVTCLLTISQDIENIMNVYINIFLLLYADDTVLMAETPEDLQKQLNIFHDYCLAWKLKVNIDKTKIVCFTNGRLPQNLQFTYSNSEIEIVKEFNYVGLLLTKTGNFKRAIKTLADKGTKAMYEILKRGKFHNLSISCQLDLFDKMVKPILLYGCELWGLSNCDIIERVHLKYCKLLLNLKSSTPNGMIYGELGRYPLYIDIKQRMVSYWIKLITGKQSKICSVVYRLMYHLCNTQNANFSWLNIVKTILDECGFSYIWETQIFISEVWLKSNIKMRLHDQFQQTWRETLHNCSKTLNYCIFKETFIFEQYFDILDEKDFLTLCKFRTTNHKLPIEHGRWNNIPRENRKCNLCNLEEIGDEFHYILNCPYFKQYRDIYIKKRYTKRPNIINFLGIMASTNRLNLTNLCKFIRIINERVCPPS